MTRLRAAFLLLGAPLFAQPAKAPDPKPGSISGTVLDTDGKPVAGVTVQTSMQIEKSRDLNSSDHHATTDQQGHYRIANIPPGKYYVYAHARDWAQKGIFPTPYPNRDRGERASRIEVASGREVTRIDFRVQLLPKFLITGHVSDVNLKVSRHINARVCEADGTSLAAEHVFGHIDSYGDFGVNVLPGTYCIDYMEYDPALKRYGRSIVRVFDRQVSEVRITPASPQTLTGSIKAPRGVAMPKLAYLIAVNRELGTVPINISRDGSFRASGVLPTKYELTLIRDGGFIKSIKLGTSELFETVLDLSVGGPLRIELGSARGSLKGTVNLAASKRQVFVVLAPTGPLMHRADLVQVSPVASTGEFLFENIAAGMYKVLASDSPLILPGRDSVLEFVPGAPVRVEEDGALEFFGPLKKEMEIGLVSERDLERARNR